MNFATNAGRASLIQYVALGHTVYVCLALGDPTAAEPCRHALASLDSMSVSQAQRLRQELNYRMPSEMYFARAAGGGHRKDTAALPTPQRVRF